MKGDGGVDHVAPGAQQRTGPDNKGSRGQFPQKYGENRRDLNCAFLCDLCALLFKDF
jgi:hypothetical protein